jgi:CheY-like chemotaxis protein
MVTKVCTESGWACLRPLGREPEGPGDAALSADAAVSADVVVVDLDNPLEGGEGLVGRISERSPFMPLVFVKKEHGHGDDFGDGLRYYIDPLHIADLEHILISVSCGFSSTDLAAASPPDFRRVPRVLIVDDNLEFANLIERSLRALERFDVRVTGSGFEAASILPMFRPDVAVIDLVLDDMDGRDVCSFIRNHEDLKQTRVIGVSGYVPEGCVSGKGGLFDAFMEKPFRAKDVVDQIVKLVQV